MASSAKLWSALQNPLRSHLDPEILFWAEQVQARNREPATFDRLRRDAERHVDSILALAKKDAPPGWPRRASPVGWNELPQANRTFLAEMAAAAAECVPEAILWLFGSRATGQARQDSDYDVMLVIPDDTPPSAVGQAMGCMWSVAQLHGAKIDHHHANVGSFEEPADGGDALLLCGNHSGAPG